MNLLNALQVISLVTILTGCGKAPELPTATTQTTDPNPVTDPNDPVLTAPPTTQPDPNNPSVTVLTFQFHNSTAICAAVHDWVPSTQTIQFPGNSGQTIWFIFRSDGVFSADVNKVITGPVDNGDTDGSTPEVIQREGAVGHPPLCYITVTNGQYTSMHY